MPGGLRLTQLPGTGEPSGQSLTGWVWAEAQGHASLTNTQLMPPVLLAHGPPFQGRRSGLSPGHQLGEVSNTGRR